MKARKVKARVLRVIDGDDWTILALEVSRLETIARAPRIAGDDATPSDTSDDATKAGYLDKAADRIRDALERAKNLGDKEKQIAADQATRAIESARELALKLATGPQVAIAKQVQGKLDAAAEVAKTIVPWYLAIGVATWIAIGVGAWLVFSSAKSGRTTRRVNRMTGAVRRGARRAGVAA